MEKEEEKEGGNVRLESSFTYRYRFLFATPEGLAISKSVAARKYIEFSAKNLEGVRDVGGVAAISYLSSFVARTTAFSSLAKFLHC